MKYKMICIDMDGTLLSSTKGITKRSKNAIKEAHELGVKVVVTTGRLFSNAAFYSHILGVETPVIAANGAVIRELKKEEVIYECPLSYENSIDLLDLIDKYNIVAHFHTSDTIIANSYISYLAGKRVMGNTHHPDYKTKVIRVSGRKKWEETLRKYDGDILKCILFSFNSKKISSFRAELKNNNNLVTFGGGRRSLEINSANVSKGNAVRELAKRLNINKEEIICIGDNENDVSMIEFAGLGVAMGNGIDAVKKKAKYITDTNDQDGVAKVIEKFILNRE
ncbi:MAG: Cof-type HAD-IIB family hydrolase [Clostridium sp.]